VALFSGGAIDNAFRARLNAQDSTFFHNRARNAGALQNFGSTAVLFQCTLSGNIVSERGAGVVNVGGSQNNTPLSSFLSLRACTITQNRAAQAGGMDNLRGVARATLSLRSCILSGNVAGATPDLASNGTVQNGGFNLIGGNPGLAPLANNGGRTLTHALLPRSPALNTGDPTPGSSFDQRGAPFARVRGGRANIGAFEVQQVPSPSPTPTPSPTFTPPPSLVPPLLARGQVRHPAGSSTGWVALWDLVELVGA